MTNAQPQPPKSLAAINQTQEPHCEKYRQFMDSSVQERTFMIEKLVETFANVIDSIWNPKLLNDPKVKVMPTRGFCNEILKRSKATYSTLQISLFYIFRVKKIVHDKLNARLKKDMQTSTSKQEELMCCGRRMFLASLMVASKYLHDKNYHNKAWAKITGLDIKEINAAEMAFLTLIDYRLFVSKPTFDRWYTQIHSHIQKSYKVQPAIIQDKPNQISNHIKDDNSTHLTYQRSINLNTSNYPSPPPDPLAPSPIAEKCYQRDDSFDIFSPPQQTTTGTKRPWEQTNDSTMNKRTC